MGGDTDTNCAIVGSIAEVIYGIDKTLKMELFFIFELQITK